MVAKKRRGKRRQQFSENNKFTYNKYKPNRQARRLGIKAETPPKQEEPEWVTTWDVLRAGIQQAREEVNRIVPPGMTYGEYLQYLKEKRKHVDEKAAKTE